VGLTEPERWGGGDETDERLVEAAVVPNEAFAYVVRDRFEEEGLFCELTPAHDTLDPFGVRVGTPVRVKCRASEVERGRALIAESLRAGEGIDWDEVDVGEAEDAVSARIASRTVGDLERDGAVLRAKAMRMYGVMLVAVGVGFVFALFGFAWVLFGVLAVSAVWLGRAHAIGRQRRRVERALREG